MKIADVAYLIDGTRTLDEYGNMVMANPEGRQVFVTYQDIYTNEFYQAAMAGLKPEFKLVLADYADYDGETLVRFRENTYEIIRTFRNRYGGIELTCTRKGGS